jgi:hypothetical protein
MTTTNGAVPFDSTGGMLGLFIGLVLAVAVIAGMWMMFEKAGRPGWAAIIPFYNLYVALKVAGMSGWWLIAFFVPFVDIVIALVLYYQLAKAFGHGIGYFFGMWLLPFIFFPLIGFGASRYVLPKYERAHSGSHGTMPTPA